MINIPAKRYPMRFEFLAKTMTNASIFITTTRSTKRSISVCASSKVPNEPPPAMVNNRGSSDSVTKGVSLLA